MRRIFCQDFAEEIPCEVVYEDEHAVAFRDISPAAPVHVLVIPRGEYVSFDDFVQKAGGEMVAGFFVSVQKVADQLGVRDGGYRLITNHGADASQSVAHFMCIFGVDGLRWIVAGDVLER